MAKTVGIIASSIAATETQCRLPGASTGVLSTPDIAAFAITDMDISWFGSLDVPTTVEQALFSQWTTTPAQRMWSLRAIFLSSAKQMRFWGSTTGANSASTADGVATTTIAAGQYFGIRATRRRSDGSTKIYFSSVDPPSWSLLGTGTVISGSTLWDSTTPLYVGGTGASVGTATNATGYFRYGEFRNGFDGAGSVVASPDVRSVVAGATSFVDTQGNTWTVGGAGCALVTMPKPS